MSRGLRIALVHGRFDLFGGAERYALELAAACAEAGHAVTVLSTTPPPPGPWAVEPLPTPPPAALWRHPSAAGKAYRHLADVWPARSALARRAGGGRFDVVHLHNWQHAGAGAVGRLARLVPVVHTVHDFALVDPSTTLDSDSWSAARRAVLAARARVLAKEFRDVRLHWPSARTRDLATAVGPDLLRNRASVVPLSARSTEDLAGLATGDPRTFLFLGRLSEHKGLPGLLDAWAAARPAGGRLLIAGDGPLRARVEAVAAAEPGISYLGPVEGARKLDALREAGWLVFPSTWHENFSISCVEALAAGRPILSSRTARPPMASDGSLVVHDRPGDLAAALTRCAEAGAEDYAGHVRSARRDGAALSWPGHVRAMLDLLTRAATGSDARVHAR